MAQHVVSTRQNIKESGLSASTGTDDGYQLALFNISAAIFQYMLILHDLVLI
jgi:hypothetical protein